MAQEIRESNYMCLRHILHCHSNCVGIPSLTLHKNKQADNKQLHPIWSILTTFKHRNNFIFVFHQTTVQNKKKHTVRITRSLLICCLHWIPPYCNKCINNLKMLSLSFAVNKKSRSSPWLHTKNKWFEDENNQLWRAALGLEISSFGFHIPWPDRKR